MSAALPAGCIRGPDIGEAERIAQELGAVDADALAAYHEGTRLLLAARRLLDDAARLESLRRTRAFLVHQLRTLEAADGEAVARALRAFDEARA